MALGMTQLLLPSHFQAASAVFDPESQLPALQTTLFHRRQWPAPSQEPSRPQVVASSGPQVAWPAAGVAPAATFAHTPGLALELHARQASVHDSLQHTPSAQKPLKHSLP